MVFGSCWLTWAALHALLLGHFGFPPNTAIWDSIVSNGLLAAATLLVSLVLGFYLPQKNKYNFIITLCGVLTGLWLLASRSLLMIVLPNAGDYAKFFAVSVPIRMALAFLVIGCMALISVLWYTIHDQQETEQRQREAEKLAREAELFNLRQQLQPHFLFNSLNSINALIGLQPQQARTMIQQLSDFLRGTLRKDDQQWTSLDEELQHLQLYLDIEKVRFGHRLSAIVTKDTEGAALRLPAMLLQPVVENAIKFGLYDTTGDITISIEAQKVDGQLHLTVTNPFDPQTAAPKKGTGFGLSSVQRRLYLLFARNDLLQVETKGEQFITTIKIPQPV